MSKVLNYNKVKKETLTIILNDEENTTLILGTPTKGVLNMFQGLRNDLKDLDPEEDNATDEIYEMCAKLLSFNKNKITITREKLEDLFDLEDIVLFFSSYQEFLNSVLSVKN